VPRLILLNGPPACGKSTLAQRYIEDHPLALNLDIDRIGQLIGGWHTDRHATGTLARAAALAAARVHLAAGHDVVIPQFVGRPAFLEAVARLARESGADFHEVVLLDAKDNAMRRFAARPTSAAVEPMALAAMYDDLLAVIAVRPGAKIVSTVDGEEDRAYQDFLACLADVNSS
jgi:predicted kinase